MNIRPILFACCTTLAMTGCVEHVQSPSNVPETRSGTYVVDQPPTYNSSYCAQCGTVERVTERQVEGRPNVGGAVVGAIIGGVVGHQFGSGRGNTAATAGGAVAGGAIGSQYNREGGTLVYDMGIRMDDGTYRDVTVAATGNLHSGSRVRIDGDHVVPI